MANVDIRILSARFLILTIGFWSTPQFSEAANRLVALNPMVAEWAAEILGQKRAVQEIVGSSEYSNYPEYMKAVSTVGPYPQIQVEKVLSLHPDLVIGSEEYNRPDQIEKLKRLKLNVIMLPKENIMRMNEWILELGKVLGEDSAAKLLSKKWSKKLDALKSIEKPKKTFFQIQFQPLISVGGESFLNDLFLKIGYENLFRTLKQSYPKVSKEAVLEKKPDVVFVFEMIKNQDDLEKVKNTWKSSKVVVLNGDDFARCSFRLLDAVERMMKYE